MRARNDAPTVRRTIVLYDGESLRLELLRRQTEADSDSEIVRKALIYYEQLFEDDANGRQLIVRDADGHDTLIPASADTGNMGKPSGALVKRNLVLHERSAERLDDLCEVTRSPSASHLVRNALFVYQMLVENTLAGKKLIVKDRITGDEKEYYIPVSCPRPKRRSSYELFSRFRVGQAANTQP